MVIDISSSSLRSTQIQDNFMLHLSEEDAIKQFEALLNQTSVLTAVFDAIHDWVSVSCFTFGLACFG